MLSGFILRKKEIIIAPTDSSVVYSKTSLTCYVIGQQLVDTWVSRHSYMGTAVAFKLDAPGIYRTVLSQLTLTSLSTAMFHFISVTVFGLVHPSPEFLSWSYNLSGAGLGLAAVGIALIIVSRRTAAKAFLSSKHRSSWMRAVPSNSVNPSRIGTPQSGTSQRSASDFRSRPQHTMPQSSTKVSSSSHHPGTSFCTTSSDKPYPDSFKTTPWGSKVERHNQDSPALESYVNPSVTTPAELPPVRAPYTKTQQNVKVSVEK